VADNPSMIKVAGLFTSPNSLSAVPQGALKTARNCVINFKDTLESCRGMEYLDYDYGTTDSRADEMFAYEGQVLVQYDDKLAYDSGAAFVDYSGTNEPPNPTVLRMKAAEAAQNFYYTESVGVKVLSSYTGTPTTAGVPRPPPPTALRYPTVKTGDPGEGWMPVNSQVGYIATLVVTDEKNNVKESNASTPIYVVNPADIALDVGDLEAVGGGGGSHVYDRIALPNGEGTLFDIGDKVLLTLAGADASFTSGIKTLNNTYASPGDDNIYYTETAGPPGFSSVAATLSSGTKNVLISIDVPSYVTTSMTLRFYRTQTTVAQDTPPNADYFLVHEHAVTSSDITAGYYQFTDASPTLSATAYYNNVNVGGELPDGDSENDNSRPPKCDDLCTWDDRLWGANYTATQSLFVDLLATSAPNGLQDGDTVTIGASVYTAVEWPGYTDPALPVGSFYVYTDSSTRYEEYPGLRVALTAQSLALAVTTDPTGPAFGYYISTDVDFPGKLFFESRTPNASPITFYVSRPSAWNPEMGSVLADALEFQTDVATNGLWFSKLEQPEAVPRLNRLAVGPRNNKILRIRPLGERLYVFTDRGIYRVSGSYPYAVDLMSKTAVLIAPDTLVEFDDALYALTSQGVCRISDAGVGVISAPIEASIKRLYGDSLSVLKRKAHGIGYESYRKYILSMPETESDTENAQSLVYDVATQTWTQWTRPVSCGVVEPVSDFLFMARNTVNKVSRERKTYSRWDYVDESFDVTVDAASGFTVTLADATGIEAGDLIYQANDCHALVESVDGDVVTVKTEEFWTVGLDTLCFKAIDCEFMFIENHAGAPEITKKWPTVTYHWKTPGFSEGVALVSSENTPANARITADLSGWGDIGWGTFAWAQPASPKNQRVVVGRQGSYLTVGFAIKEALAVWASYGYTPQVEPLSDRNSR
jgi:hypothetical protein